MSSNESMAPSVVSKVMREVRSLISSPLEGVTVHFSDESCISVLTADMVGPVGTPFAGGVFRLTLTLPSTYPTLPPRGNFQTKIFHPNVSKTGEICVNTLKKDWAPNLGIRHVLLVIRCLLIQPNAESALNEDAGKLILESFDDFTARAKLMTELHATPAISSPTSQQLSSASSAKTVSASKPSPPSAQTALTAVTRHDENSDKNAMTAAALASHSPLSPSAQTSTTTSTTSTTTTTTSTSTMSSPVKPVEKKVVKKKNIMRL